MYGYNCHITSGHYIAWRILLPKRGRIGYRIAFAEMTWPATLQKVRDNPGAIAKDTHGNVFNGRQWNVNCPGCASRHARHAIWNFQKEH